MKTAIFVVLLAASIGFFIRTMVRFTRAMLRGRHDQRSRFDQLGQRLLSVLVYFFGQKKVAEEGPQHMTSKHHLLIFWGFLVITIASAELLVNGLVPALSLELLPSAVYVPLKILIDVFNFIVLMMVAWALFRRIVIKPHLIPMNLDAGLILGSIACLMITHFLFHGFKGAEHGMEARRALLTDATVTASAEPNFVSPGGAGLAVSPYEYPPGAPISNIVASWLISDTQDPAALDRAIANAHFGKEVGYWLHILILLAFLNYLPYSKHIHLLGALPNIFTRNLSKRRMDLPKLDLEDETQWGVGRYEQFSWKSLLDNYACTECARCTNYCPAYATGKNLSPMQLIHDIRYEMLDRDALHTAREELKVQAHSFAEHGYDPDHKPADLVHLETQLGAIDKKLEDMPLLTGGRVAEDTLWACTTCGACQEVCPVFIEHPLKIIQMRQNLVLEQEAVPAELGRTFRNIERQSNPWGIANDKRMEWAEGLEVPTIEEKPNPEYLLWVGCAGAFDNRIIKQTKAMVKVLNAASVDYAVLGHQEGCTGDPARRAGNEFLFEMLAEQNIETLNDAGVKKIITSCPHCLHTFKQDYPQFGGHYEVIHHTQLLSHLLSEGKLVPEKQSVASVTYHDSCYLGRWNGEFEAPRAVLEKLPITGGLTEMTRNKRHGFCCGAGGARMFMEEDSPRVNDNRTKEAIATGAAAVAVACPFCNIMITDGMKTFDKEDDIAVLDIAELVADTLPDVPVGNLVRHKPKAPAEA